MLTQHLERCNQFISLDPVERSEFIAHYNSIRDYVISNMKKENNLFNKYYNGDRLSGSYADQLKVSKPNEYDVLVILNFPYQSVQPIKGKPGFVQINLMRSWRDDIGEFKEVIDNDGYLMQNKVLEWLRRIMKSIFPRPVNWIPIGNHQYKIIHSVSGPANTLTIQCVISENKTFSIDFVGALEFSVNDYWMADADIPKERFLDKFWNAIPKPRKPTPKPSNSQRYPRRYSNGAKRNYNKNRDWICSYAPIERVLIHDLGFIKPLIRIFKKIRDTHEMTNLKSYYIKQIFIHQLMLKCEHEQYWERSLGELLLEMLDVIIQYLEGRRLPSFWHKNFDLFHHFKPEQIADIKRKFRHIKQNIASIIDTNEPEYIYDVILTEPEQQQINEIV